jgi:hypothetical protein
MPLGVGQIIKVTVIDIPLADAGLPTIPKIFATPHEVDRAKYFAYCKRTYLALREKYDSTNE